MSAQGTRVLVCGGRVYNDRTAVYNVLDAVHALEPISLLIHGACCDKETGELCGADGLAEQWAISRQIPYCGMPAKWNQHGRSAGPIRNGEMLAKWKPQRVVAFPGSLGTVDMVHKSRAAGIDVIEAEHVE